MDRFLRVYKYLRMPFEFFSSVKGFLVFWGFMGGLYAVGSDESMQLFHDILFFIGTVLSLVLSDEGGLQFFGVLTVWFCFLTFPCMPGWLMKFIERKTGINKHFEPKIYVDDGELVFTSKSQGD